MLNPKTKMELKIGECYEVRWSKDPDTGVFITVGILQNVTYIHKKFKMITELYLAGHPSHPYQKIDINDVTEIRPIPDKTVIIDLSSFK